MDARTTYIRDTLLGSAALKQRVAEDGNLLAAIEAVAAVCIEALQRGNRIILAGNGGSAADAQHIAAEFVSRFMYDRPGLPAMALTTDTSMLTAIGNDYGFEKLFARQLEANARAGDVFIGISTSGNSPNVLLALSKCKEMGVISVGLAGQGGKIQEACDHVIAVPSSETPRIQETHITIGHAICGLIESAIFPRHG
ncbi:D-sedoheptulose 7-phosphate isomerase [Massilia sp. TS11]|nr:D-sedoheptulose 7-phosphate isomerase [Massilia sp. TS11]